MSRSEIIIRIGGEGGEGVISTGDMFSSGAARSGYHVFTFRTYPAEIKGGHAWFQVRVGSKPVLSIGDGVDVLVAFNAEAYQRHNDQLKEGGVLIYDPDEVTPTNGKYQAYPFPFNRIARKELDFVRGKNLVVLGVMASLFGLDPDSLEGIIRSRLSRRAELLEKNLQSLEVGVEYASKVSRVDDYRLAPPDGMSRLVMSGNEAIVAGSLVAGCRFYAGYPITPASDIMEALAKELPKVGGGFLQAEDEIAALGCAVGASFTGLKAMTATSGPGLSLMTEFLGYASMAEVPVVIVDVQRAGPSTGMPTKLEQGDLYHALYAGHGDVPRIVMAPGCVEDCFFQTINAFNLAEEFQGPVILISDQSLSHRTQTITMPDLSPIKIANRRRPTAAEFADYKRYAITKTGVSPFAVPGDSEGIYVGPGLEHDEHGMVSAEDAENHRIMTEKRFRKLDYIRGLLGPAPRYGDPNPDIGIIGWGSTEGSIREAVAIAQAEGYKVAMIHPRVLNPLNEEQIGEFIASVKKVIVPESNYQGQFANLLAATFGVKPVKLNKFGGLPFAPGEIYRKIVEVMGQ